MQVICALDLAIVFHKEYLSFPVLTQRAEPLDNVEITVGKEHVVCKNK